MYVFKISKYYVENIMPLIIYQIILLICDWSQSIIGSHMLKLKLVHILGYPK